jgi:hypothetical protein
VLAYWYIIVLLLYNRYISVHFEQFLDQGPYRFLENHWGIKTEFYVDFKTFVNSLKKTPKLLTKKGNKSRVLPLLFLFIKTFCFSTFFEWFLCCNYCITILKSASNSSFCHSTVEFGKRIYVYRIDAPLTFFGNCKAKNGSQQENAFYKIVFLFKFCISFHHSSIIFLEKSQNHSTLGCSIMCVQEIVAIKKYKKIIERDTKCRLYRTLL